MNLSDIQSLEAAVPVAATVARAIAVAAVLFSAAVAAVLVVRKKGFSEAAQVITVVPLLIAVLACVIGAGSMDSANRGARELAFEQRLASEYGMATSMSMYSVEVAAHNRAPIEVKHGDKLISIRPYITGDTLTFHNTDGTLIAPAQR